MASTKLRERRSMMWQCVLLASIVAHEVGAQSAPNLSTLPTPRSASVTEALGFMDAYARDLRLGSRAALAARYAPAGVRQIQPGRVQESSLDEVKAFYQDAWSPPIAFAWRDLKYDVLAEDAVLVSGAFDWTLRSWLSPVSYQYVALLRREPNNEFRIALEAESPVPPLWFICSVALVLVAFGLTIGWFGGRRLKRRSPAQT